MLEIVEHKAGKEQCARLFPSQELIAHIVQILQWNKTLKGRVNQALAECNSARNRRVWEGVFKYFSYGCLLSRHSSILEEPVALKAQ